MRRVAVAIILNPSFKMLMGRRRDSGRMTNPAGSANDGEDAYAAVCREVKEETGLDVQEAQLVHVGTGRNNLLIYTFLCRCSGKIDATQDPDLECETWNFVDPFQHLDNLHVPAEINNAVQWYGRHYDVLSSR